MRQLSRLCFEGFRLGFRLLKPETMRWIPRLITEGLGPVRHVIGLKLIEAHNMREIKNLLADDVPITFVTSFPRSGNTWMRYLLSDVFLQIHGIDTDTKLPIHPDEIIADFYRSRVALRNKAVRTPGVLLKSHDSFKELQERFWGKDCRNTSSFQRCRHLYLYRSPEDALVSLYHYVLRENLPGALKKPQGVPISTISAAKRCRVGLSTCPDTFRRLRKVCRFASPRTNVFWPSRPASWAKRCTGWGCPIQTRCSSAPI